MHDLCGSLCLSNLGQRLNSEGHWGIKTVAYFVRQLSNNNFNLPRNAKAVRCKCQIAICLCWRWDILLWKNPMPKIFFILTNRIKELHWSNFDFQRMMAHLTSLVTFGYFRPKWLPNFMLSRYYWAVFAENWAHFYSLCLVTLALWNRGKVGLEHNFFSRLYLSVLQAADYCRFKMICLWLKLKNWECLKWLKKRPKMRSSSPKRQN